MPGQGEALFSHGLEERAGDPTLYKHRQIPPQGRLGVAGAGADERPGVGSRCQPRETPAGVGKEQLISNAPCCLCTLQQRAGSSWRKGLGSCRSDLSVSWSQQPHRLPSTPSLHVSVWPDLDAHLLPGRPAGAAPPHRRPGRTSPAPPSPLPLSPGRLLIYGRWGLPHRRPVPGPRLLGWKKRSC